MCGGVLRGKDVVLNLANSMKKVLLKGISKTLDEFEIGRMNLTDKAATKVIRDIFIPLLENDGYVQNKDSMRRHSYLHYIASKGKRKNRHTVGVVFRKEQTQITKDEVEDLVAACTMDDVDSVIFVSTSPTETNAYDYDRENYPVKFQKLDFEGIRRWIKKLIDDRDESEVSKILVDCTQRIIEAIFKNPDYLEDVEWRDLERVIAELFRGIGFGVVLTPSSKDGGKDIIVEFQKKDKTLSYIVEIKHWRSNQKVGKDSLVRFVKVVAKEKRTAGLFLATYGFAENALESLTKVERKKARFGDKEKIISLCETYIKGGTGLWLRDFELERVLMEKTL